MACQRSGHLVALLSTLAENLINGVSKFLFDDRDDT